NTDLMATVDSILNDEAKLNSMKLSAKQMGRPDAAAKLVEAVLSIMK
ncbi:undecaprenyldiphospho-muramoylpentapeptide beta-N-acetylglucosaminyltransferase, partial [Listeria monocytogenes]